MLKVKTGFLKIVVISTFCIASFAGCSQLTSNSKSLEKVSKTEILGVVSASGIVKPIDEKEIYFNGESKIERINVTQYQAVDLNHGLILYDGDKWLNSPIKGVVSEINVMPGQIVSSNMPVMKIVNPERVKVDIKLSEVFIDEVLVGHKVLITTNPIWDIERALEDLNKGNENNNIAEGVVNILSPIAERKRTIEGEEVYFIAEVEIKKRKDFLKPGRTVFCSVITGKKEDVLTVPHEAIKQDGISTYVFVYRGGIIEERKIETGLKSSDSVEVVKGIEEGEKVVMYPESNYKTGMAISAK